MGLIALSVLLSCESEVLLIASVLKASICEVNSVLECFKVLQTFSSKWLTLSYCFYMFKKKSAQVHM